MKRFNNWLGNKLADSMSTMAFFYFCVALDLVDLVLGNPMSWGIVQWVTYVSQVVIQLCALPLLAFQNKVQQDNHHETIRHIQKIHKHLKLK